MRKIMSAKQVVKTAIHYARYAQETRNTSMLARCKQTVNEYFPMRHSTVSVIV